MTLPVTSTMRKLLAENKRLHARLEAVGDANEYWYERCMKAEAAANSAISALERRKFAAKLKYRLLHIFH